MTPAIHRLHLARVDLKGAFNPPTYTDTRIDVFAYLVLSDSDVVLVDTGVGIGNGYIDRAFNPSRASIADKLAKFDLAPTAVTKIVNSHLHFDHCGNNTLFPNADVFIQETELKAAHAAGYTVTEWFDYPAARLSPVSGDCQIADGITLIATPGHTPGHQSVLIERPQETVIIAAQAAFTADEFLNGGHPAEQAHDGFAAAYKKSIARLKSFGAREVYFSHDTSTTAD